MSKSSIYEKIEEKGRIEAEEIYSTYQEKANLAVKTIMEEIIDACNKTLKQAEDKNNSFIKTKQTSLIQSSKQTILLKKKQLVHDTFEKAKASLVSLNKEELKSYVSKNCKDVTLTNALVYVKEDEVAKYDEIFKELGMPVHGTKALKPLSGGFIVISDIYDLDFSFDAILAELEDEMEKEIADMLFQEV